jgi:hypothetical protein
MKAYLTSAIDATPDSSPSTFRGAKHKRVTCPDMKEYTANSEGNKPEPITDVHGEILGEVHNLQFDEDSW